MPLTETLTGEKSLEGLFLHSFYLTTIFFFGGGKEQRNEEQ